MKSLTEGITQKKKGGGGGRKWKREALQGGGGKRKKGGEGFSVFGGVIKIIRYNRGEGGRGGMGHSLLI